MGAGKRNTSKRHKAEDYMRRLFFVSVLCAAMLASVSLVQAQEAGDTWVEPVTGMEFVWVPGGCFRMGCGGFPNDCGSVQSQIEEVCVEGYWLAKYEVTQGQWQAVMGDNPSGFRDAETYPVEQVSWDDAQAFIAELEAKGGDAGLRLPTETEWEFACRAGGQDITYAGSNDPGEVAWFNENSRARTHAVGEKAPNSLGLYDMSGNVWEWVQETVNQGGGSTYSRDNLNEEPSLSQVLRGGGWNYTSWFSRCATTYFLKPDFSDSSLGLRLARSE
ncbi:MAG: formylglycine-generating enzyme family protein [Desulfovibrio sp.]|nr:MAG: formylglycine-generating enzyme family protein [Desulfovibrio sp.]